MSPVALSPRKRLRHFLEQQLAVMKEDKSSLEALVDTPFLRQTVEALVALDYGETQAIFAPGDKKGAKDGTKPYTLRKLRMRAIGFVDLLIANKYKGEEAVIRTVADAHGQKADTFRAWRKTLGKTTDSLMQSFRTEIAKLDWDEGAVLDKLKKAGAEYLLQKKLAHKSKK